MVMKTIFLDHDGVVCLSNNWGGRKKKWAKYRSTNPGSSKYLNEAPVDVRFDDFDKKSIKVLNEILNETGAEIVVSSDWRFHATLEELGDYYKSQGICKKPIAFTDNRLPQGLKFFNPYTDLEETRSYQILDWLGKHPEVTHWVAVDDLNMSEKFGDVSGGYQWGLNNFVWTPKPKEGIKQCGVKEKIINFLNK
jgi:hypothetical protein